MKVRVNPRSIGAEGPFITTDVRKLARLKRDLMDAGMPSDKANGLIGWLVDKAAGERDVTGPATRSSYRKALADLSAHNPRRAHRRRLARLELAAA